MSVVVDTSLHLGFHKGGCPIHLKGAPEVERRKRRGGGVCGGGCAPSENFCISYIKIVSFYAFPVTFIDTVLFKKGHPNQNGGCPDALDTPWIRPCIKALTVGTQRPLPPEDRLRAVFACRLQAS